MTTAIPLVSQLQALHCNPSSTLQPDLFSKIKTVITFQTPLLHSTTDYRKSLTSKAYLSKLSTIGPQHTFPLLFAASSSSSSILLSQQTGLLLFSGQAHNFPPHTSPSPWNMFFNQLRRKT